MTLEDRMLSTPPKWVNPCGLAAETFDGDLDVVQLQDDQLLQQVVVQAKTALSHAKLFRDNYVSNRMYYISHCRPLEKFSPLTQSNSVQYWLKQEIKLINNYYLAWLVIIGGFDNYR